MTDKRETLTAYYDGKCPMCSSIVDTVRGSGAAADFTFCDMHAAKKLPFDKAAIEKEIHLTDGDGNVYRGADAILRIADQYPRFRLLTRLARTPPARMLAPLVYNFVARNRRFLLGPASRLYWLKTAIVIAFATGLALSPHLWTGPRSFPLSPVWDGLPAMPDILAVTLYAALFLLSLAVLLSSKPQPYIAGLLAVVVVFCLFDQTRWQPWVFQYSCLLATLAVFSWNDADKAGLERTLNIARLIIAATYIYSGLQKANLNFAHNDFPWIVQPITTALPWTAASLRLAGFAVPVVQVCFGLGLLTRRFRRLSLVAAVAMHVFILAMLGPFGLDWNAIVWPWTAAMAVFDILLFGGTVDATPRAILWPGRNLCHAAMLLLFAVLPLASFVNLWDSYLSAALYSGNLTDAQIYVSDAGFAALPAPIRHAAVHTSADTNVINLQRWSVEDLNVGPYPETRVYKSIAKSLCAALPDPAQLALVVREQRLFFSRPETAYRCWDL